MRPDALGLTDSIAVLLLVYLHFFEESNCPEQQNGASFDSRSSVPAGAHNRVDASDSYEKYRLWGEG